MPSNYVKITIGELEIQVEDPEQLPVSINYSLEDAEDFTKKTSSNALSLQVPATLMNDKAANTFRNPGMQDLTTGEAFRGNQKCTIESNGNELLTGKAFLNGATHTDRPIKYEFDLYGDNADWVIDLQEKTLYDLLKHIAISFSRETIVSSWNFDGTNEALPYVFAPIRYRNSMDAGLANLVDTSLKPIDDFHMRAIYMKPSISVYWVLFWGLKSVGYRIQSHFVDTEYLRRQVMPWTWGSFLTSEGTNLDIHKFKAKSTEKTYTWGKFDGYIDLKASNDFNNGMSDPNGDYLYNASEKRAEWTYRTNFNYGPLIANFSITVDIESKASWNSDVEVKLEWARQDINGTLHDQETHIISSVNSPAVSSATDVGLKDDFYKVKVLPGEKVFLKAWVHIFESKTGFGSVATDIVELNLVYFDIPLGGSIFFENFNGLKNYKFLDFLKGIVGLYNLSFNTDPINKVVYIEPTHRYSLNDAVAQPNPGYFVDDFKDWNGKEDLSREWRLENYRDYEKELSFTFKDDGNDGILKVIQDRNINRVAASKYVFPERFKTGKKQIENPFFSPLMQYEVEQWKFITGIAPQMPCMVPENISNTSASEAENTFTPKIGYYKGLMSGVGGWRFENETLTTFPFLFSVNYKEGGQNDPILSYSDEKIKAPGGFTLGKGLVKRFYWQRLATIRNGQWYNCWFRLKNTDVAGQLHREYISYQGQKWELINIKDYRPLLQASTAVLMRRWAPVSEADFNNTFPSQNSVIDGSTPNPLDVKYAQLLALISDIPTD